MFDEILKSIRAYLYERTSSPLIGSFMVSWLIWNHRFILLWFSSTPVKEKFILMDTVLYATWQHIYLQGILYPTITALLYIFVYPYPAKFVFSFTRKRQKEITDIKKEIEDETLLTISESRAIRSEIYKLEEESQNTITRKDSVIQSLKDEIDSYKTTKTTNISKTKKAKPKTAPFVPLPTKDNITDSQIKILMIVGSSKYDVEESELLSQYGSEQIKAKYDLQELENNDYLKKDWGDGSYQYTLTHKGRAYLLKNDFV